ncbi:MAG: tRNA pseudouridine(55) synthase TruB [bacterium]|nr:tRNA pseudouridine(55) synthase TruB [bacterium]
MNQDILLIDKPKGWSSFDVIRELRRRLGIRKMGHAGTLDPLATGLLLIGIGEGTKRLAELIGLPKTYRMAVLLGKRTATGDSEGEILEARPIGAVAEEAVTVVLAGMIGEIELPVPMYSAVKYHGQPLYRYARRGIRVPEKRRTTKIYGLTLSGIRTEGGAPVLDIELTAAKGTYARAVAEEIGRRLGVPASILELRRTRIGGYDIRDAKRLDEIAFPPSRRR